MGAPFVLSSPGPRPMDAVEAWLQLALLVIWVAFALYVLLLARKLDSERGSPAEVEAARSYASGGSSQTGIMLAAGGVKAWHVGASWVWLGGLLLALVLLTLGYSRAFKRLSRAVAALPTGASALSLDARDAADRVRPWVRIMLLGALVALLLAVLHFTGLA